MNKLKVNPNLVSVLLLVGLFAGYQYMIWAVLFVFLCEENENLKQMAIKVVALFAACILLEGVWYVVTLGYDALVGGIDGIFNIIYAIDDTVEMPEFITVLFDNILGTIIQVVGYLVSLLIMFTKVSFVLSTISNKAFKPMMKLDEYLTKFANYILGVVSPQPQAAPAAPQQDQTNNQNPTA